MTIHRDVWAEHAARLAETAEGRRRIKEARAFARECDWAHIIGSGYQRMHPGQLLALVEVAAMIARGDVSACQIEVGHEPYADQRRDLNAGALDHLCPPFTASVSPGHHGDGYLSWSESIVTDRLGGDEAQVPIEPWHAPLEIGDSLASRTWLHLAEEGAVARWAYDEDCIHLLVLDPVVRAESFERTAIDLDLMAEMIGAIRAGYVSVEI